MTDVEQVELWVTQIADAMETDDMSEAIGSLVTAVWALPELQIRALLVASVNSQGLAMWRKANGVPR